MVLNVAFCNLNFLFLFFKCFLCKTLFLVYFSTILLSLIVFPNSISQIIIIKEQCIIFAIKIISYLPICNSHGFHLLKLLNLCSSLLWIHTSKLSLHIILLLILHLIIIVNIIINLTVHAHLLYRVLLIVFIHNFQIHLIVHLKPSYFYFVFPHFIMELNIV